MFFRPALCRVWQKGIRMKSFKNKIGLRLLCALLALLCVLSLASCDLAAFLPSGLLDGDSGDGGSGGSGDGGFTPSDIDEVTKDSFENSYRDQLNANEKAIYDTVANAEAGAHAFTVTLTEPLSICKDREPSEGEKEDASSRVSFWITNALYAVWLDKPHLFWMETGNYEYAYSMVPDDDAVYSIKEITVTVEARANAQNAVQHEASIDALLSTLSLRKATDYDTVAAINDYLCARIDYVDTADRQNVYGALIGRKCVCEGYAHAFKLLCDKFGITCATIIGTGYTEDGSEGHMWNAVRLDGKWYAVDVTWNDQADKNARNAFLAVGTETDSFGDTFAETHVAEYTRGTSKVFASPKLEKTAYKK